MRLTPFRSLVVAALFAVLASLSTAPHAAQATREGVMFVSAVDRDGEPVSDLGPDAFQIKEDGIKREVLRVSRATEPLDVAVLIDNSAAASDDITFLRTGLSKFVARMAPPWRIDPPSSWTTPTTRSASRRPSAGCLP
jgi:hypothetical protein